MNHLGKSQLSSSLNAQAWEKLENGDYQNALTDVLKSIELYSSFNNNDTAALIYLNLTEYGKALLHADLAVSLTQISIDKIERAKTLSDLGQTEQGLEDLIEIIRSEGKDGVDQAKKSFAEHYITRAKILIKLNRLRDAEEDIVTAIELGADKKAFELIPNTNHSKLNDTEGLTTDSITNPKNIQKTKYPNGMVKTLKEVNSNQQPHGNYSIYHPNGIKKVNMLFNNGLQKEGAIDSYDVKGNKIRAATINRLGKFHGEVINYWPNGNVKESLAYENDSLVGQIRNYDYFGNEICCVDAEKILHSGIDARNKSNYYISLEQYQKDVVFKQFLEELGGDFQHERLATEYSIRKQYTSIEDAAEAIKNFNKKFDFNRVQGELEQYRKGDYEIVRVENIIILAYLPFFHIKEANWGVNEYSNEFVELDWIQGIGLVYKVSDPLKYPDVQDQIKWNIPYHNYHDNGIENITVRCKSSAIAEYLADQIILENGGFDYFQSITDQEIWRDTEYAFKGPLFVIFISGSDIVINRIKSQMVHISDTTVKEGISEFSDAINKAIPGLNRLIYNEGEGHVKDGRFWINSAGTMISSFLPDYKEACSLYLNILKKHDPENKDHGLSIEEMVHAESKTFEIKKEDFWITLSQGVDVKHINIMLFNDKFKTNQTTVPKHQQSIQEIPDNKSITDEEDIEEPEVKERIYLDHMIWCSGYFTIRRKDGKLYKVEAQKHHLREFYQEWDSETMEWESFGDDQDLDEFYLTANEDGFRFQEEDVEEYFGEIYDYDWNGLSNDWCGIESFEPVELSQKKWEDYKNRFPKLTSKDQFTYSITEDNSYNHHL